MAKETEFYKCLESNARKTEKQLDSLLPVSSDNSVTSAMRYAVLNGGKRLRAFLVMEASKIFSVPEQQALQAAAAIECIHSYSLVHDDLPAMDDDDIRRGKLTVHKKWNDATAILVGDGLQSLAFEILSMPATHPDPSVRLDLISSLCKASGAHGMVGGQAQDMEAGNPKRTLGIDDVMELQNLKTGKLIVWAAEAGSRLAKEDSKPFTDYAKSIGLAFQIRDDILDVVGEKQQIGKSSGKDSKAGKVTFVSLLGLKEATLKAQELVSNACDSIHCYGKKSEMLKELAKFTVARSH